MALSEREQKVLDQLEELMHAEDPQFASSMSSTGNTAPVFSARHMVLGILCVLAGLGIIIGALKVPPLRRRSNSANNRSSWSAWKSAGMSANRGVSIFFFL